MLSTEMDCSGISLNQLDNSPSVGGYYSSDTDTLVFKTNITIDDTTYFLPDKIVNQIRRHETIHRIQYLQNRETTCCDNYFKQLNSEVEAYTMEYFPDKFLNWFYNTNLF
jgi:hypothetical protein